MPGESLPEKLAETLAVVERLTAENAVLRDRIALFEAELGRNSENSAKPLSILVDGLMALRDEAWFAAS